MKSYARQVIKYINTNLNTVCGDQALAMINLIIGDLNEWCGQTDGEAHAEYG